MDLSIIIVSYNTKKLTDECLTSIKKSLSGSSIIYEIIVVDNVSTDGSREMLEKKYPEVVTIYNSENVGFGRANNQGMRRAKGTYFLLINSDTLAINKSIPKLYEFSKNHPRMFVGPKLLNMDRSPQTSCGPFLTLPVIFAALFLKGDVIGLTRWSPNKTRFVDWVSGACIIASKKLFMDDLLFDENIFMYMEEIDLLMRARKKGYRTYFYPGSQIVHLGGGSSTNKRTGPVLNIYKGMVFVYKKHYSKFALFFLRILLKKKALISIAIGYLTGSDYLKKTYAEAYTLV
ncbi:MAG: glycosyltransferase family 2 protein [Candidatus Gottesmanbacteria bacterium]